MNAPSKDATEALEPIGTNGSPVGQSSADGRESPPLSGQKKLIAIKEVIEALDPDDPNNWNMDGRPDCHVISKALKVMVKTHERDEVWEAMQAVKDMPEVEGEGPIDPMNIAVEQHPAKPTHVSRGEPWKGSWAVIDSLARRAARVHYPLGVDGTKVTLRADQPTPMPREIAVKFLCDGAFKVFNQYGEPVLSLPDQEITVAGRSTSMDLKPDEVVAKLGELTMESLLIRVNRLPGGEQFGEDSRREAIENFYIDTRRAIGRATPDGFGDDEFADLPDSRTSELLEGV